jgi:hypothetical protein
MTACLAEAVGGVPSSLVEEVIFDRVTFSSNDRAKNLHRVVQTPATGCSDRLGQPLCQQYHRVTAPPGCIADSVPQSSRPTGIRQRQESGFASSRSQLSSRVRLSG